MFIYKNHLGGIYYTDEALDYNDIYCKTCGDCDTYLGEADTFEEAIELLKPITNKIYKNHEGCYLCGGYKSECDEFCDGTFYTGGYDEKYIKKVLEGME